MRGKIIFIHCIYSLFHISNWDSKHCLHVVLLHEPCDKLLALCRLQGRPGQLCLPSRAGRTWCNLPVTSDTAWSNTPDTSWYNAPCQSITAWYNTPGTSDIPKQPEEIPHHGVSRSDVFRLNLSQCYCPPLKGPQMLGLVLQHILISFYYSLFIRSNSYHSVHTSPVETLFGQKYLKTKHAYNFPFAKHRSVLLESNITLLSTLGEGSSHFVYQTAWKSSPVILLPKFICSEEEEKHITVSCIPESKIHDRMILSTDFKLLVTKRFVSQNFTSHAPNISEGYLQHHRVQNNFNELVAYNTICEKEFITNC